MLLIKGISKFFENQQFLGTHLYTSARVKILDVKPVRTHSLLMIWQVIFTFQNSPPSKVFGYFF